MPSGEVEEIALEKARCAADKVYWFDTYVWTYNPKLPTGERWIKFVLFPKQIEYLKWRKDRIEAHEDGLVEKSRDVGLSWLNIGDQIHEWLFSPDFAGGFGSATEIKLDRVGDPSSLFEKGRLLLKRLPAWMLPEGFDLSRHATKFKFINPETSSTITGEAGDEIGRSGRTTVYDVDEGAFVEHADRVEAALSATTDTVIWTSTVNGVGNLFWKKRFSLPTKQVFIYDWRDDPRKSPDETGCSSWYEAQKQRFAHNPALLASEVDRDYSASVEGVVILGRWVQAAINFAESRGLPDQGFVAAAADIAAGGSNFTVAGARRGIRLSATDSWSEENTTITARKLIDFTRAQAAKLLNYDALGVGIGCKSTFDLEKDEDGRSTLGFETNAILGGDRPTENQWPDGKTSREMFHNFRAELAWCLRERFRKTYEVVQGVAEHPTDELISIPLIGDLIAQLSIPMTKHMPTGKKRVESKTEMVERGVGSPDWFDMLMYLFAPEPVKPYIANVMSIRRSDNLAGPANPMVPTAPRRNRVGSGGGFIAR